MEDRVRNLTENQDVRMMRSYFTFNMVEDPAKRFINLIMGMEGNARTLIVAWSAQGEFKNEIFSFVTTGYE